MSVPRNENPNQYGDILLVAEGRREQDTVGDKKKTMCMHGAPLGYKTPHRSRTVGTACLPHRLPLSPLRLESRWGAVAWHLAWGRGGTCTFGDLNAIQTPIRASYWSIPSTTRTESRPR